MGEEKGRRGPRLPTPDEIREKAVYTGHYALRLFKTPVFWNVILHFFFAACSLTLGLWSVGYLDNVGQKNSTNCNIQNIRGMLIANIVLSFVGMYAELTFCAAYIVEAITNWNTDTTTEYFWVKFQPASAIVAIIRLGVGIAHLVLVIVITVQSLGKCATEIPAIKPFAQSYAVGSFIFLALCGAGMIAKIVLMVLGYFLHVYDPKTAT